MQEKIYFKYFIIEYANWNKKITGLPSLIDGDFTSIEKLSELDINDNIIICLGNNYISDQEIFNNIIKYSNKGVYSYDFTKEKVESFFKGISKDAEINYRQCLKYNIKHYDTSKNRNEVLNKIINDID